MTINNSIQRVSKFADDAYWLNPDIRDSLRVVANAAKAIEESDETAALKELIVHMNVHSGYEQNGYFKMTQKQKQLYDDVWREHCAEHLDGDEV